MGISWPRINADFNADLREYFYTRIYHELYQIHHKYYYTNYSQMTANYSRMISNFSWVVANFSRIYSRSIRLIRDLFVCLLIRDSFVLFVTHSCLLIRV